MRCLVTALLIVWLVGVYPAKVVITLLIARPAAFVGSVIREDPWDVVGGAVTGLALGFTAMQVPALDPRAGTATAVAYICLAAYLVGCAVTAVGLRACATKRRRLAAAFDVVPHDTITAGQALGLLAGLLCFEPYVAHAVNSHDPHVYYAMGVCYLLGFLSGIVGSGRVDSTDVRREERRHNQRERLNRHRLHDYT